MLTFTYNRCRVLFDWATDARRLNSGVSFQVRVGLTYLQPFNKYPGETFHSIPIAQFAGMDMSNLPASSFKEANKATEPLEIDIKTK